MSKVATKTNFLIRDLLNLAKSYEGEAQRIREFVSKLEGTVWADLPGSYLDTNVRRLVMDGFNTSGRISSAESAIQNASEIVNGK